MASASASASAATGYEALAVRELKSILTERGVDHSACVEKSDLVDLCKGAGGDERWLARIARPGVFRDIEQGTDEWARLQRGSYGIRVDANEIGDILNVSGLAKPLAAYEKIMAQRYKMWGRDEESPQPHAHDHICKPLIAGMYARAMAADLAGGGYFIHPDPDLGMLYGASPDRRIVDPDGSVAALLVIEAPVGRMHTHVKPGIMAQLQYQMWCSGLPVCVFLAVKLDHKDPEKTFPSRTRIFLARVYRSEEYIAWMIPRLLLFSKCLILEQPPPRDLYENEQMGFAPPPKPRIEEVEVETGAEAWRVRPLPQEDIVIE
jgi:hypothetical protein